MMMEGGESVKTDAHLERESIRFESSVVGSGASPICYDNDLAQKMVDAYLKRVELTDTGCVDDYTFGHKTGERWGSAGLLAR